MVRFGSYYLLLALLLGLPKPARADGRWDYRVDITSTTSAFGFRPGKILSDDGTGTFVGADGPGARTEIRGRMRIVGESFRFDLEPYTVIPDDGIRVNLGGIETSLMYALVDWAEVGLYHHSSHNFSDSSYGWGIDLNAVVVDLRIFEIGFQMLEEKGSLRLHFLGHGYLKGQASPYVLTKTSNVAAGEIGSSTWKGAVLFEGVHPRGRTECSVIVIGREDFVPASLQVTLAATAKLGLRFLGTLGEHVYLGPFIGYGQNLSRHDDFGSFTVYGGLRVDMLFADTINSPRDQ